MSFFFQGLWQLWAPGHDLIPVICRSKVIIVTCDVKCFFHHQPATFPDMSSVAILKGYFSNFYWKKLCVLKTYGKKTLLLSTRLHSVPHLSCFCPKKRWYNAERHTLSHCFLKDGSPVTVEHILAASTLLVARHASWWDKKAQMRERDRRTRHRWWSFETLTDRFCRLCVESRQLHTPTASSTAYSMRSEAELTRLIISSESATLRARRNSWPPSRALLKWLGSP